MEVSNQVSEQGATTGAVAPHEEIFVEPTDSQLESLNVVEDPLASSTDDGLEDSDDSLEDSLEDFDDSGEDEDDVLLSDQLEAAGVKDVDSLIDDIAEFGTFDENSYQDLVERFGEETASQIEDAFIEAYSDDSDDSDDDELTSLREFKDEAERSALVEEATLPLGGKDQMIEDANRLLDAGLTSEEELEELGGMLMAGGLNAELAIERFKSQLTALEQPTSFQLGGEHLQNNGNMKIGQREYGKLASEASNRGDTQALEQLNKRMMYSLKAFPNLWE